MDLSSCFTFSASRFLDFVSTKHCVKCQSLYSVDYSLSRNWPKTYFYGLIHLCSDCLGEVGIYADDGPELPPSDVLSCRDELDKFISFVQDPIHRWIFIRASFAFVIRGGVWDEVTGYYLLVKFLQLEVAI